MFKENASKMMHEDEPIYQKEIEDQMKELSTKEFDEIFKTSDPPLPPLKPPESSPKWEPWEPKPDERQLMAMYAVAISNLVLAYVGLRLLRKL